MYLAGSNSSNRNIINSRSSRSNSSSRRRLFAKFLHDFLPLLPALKMYLAVCPCPIQTDTAPWFSKIFPIIFLPIQWLSYSQLQCHMSIYMSLSLGQPDQKSKITKKILTSAVAFALRSIYCFAASCLTPPLSTWINVNVQMTLSKPSDKRQSFIVANKLLYSIISFTQSYLWIFCHGPSVQCPRQCW